MMIKNNVDFDIEKKHLYINDSNYIAKNILDIDFFNSRKSRILDNIKTHNNQKIIKLSIDDFK